MAKAANDIAIINRMLDVTIVNREVAFGFRFSPLDK